MKISIQKVEYDYIEVKPSFIEKLAIEYERRCVVRDCPLAFSNIPCPLHIRSIPCKSATKDYWLTIFSLAGKEEKEEN